MILPAYDHESIADNYLTKPKKVEKDKICMRFFNRTFHRANTTCCVTDFKIFVALNFQYAVLVIG